MVTKEPSLKNLTDRNYGRPPEQQHLPLQELTRSHVDSFNYVIKEGLHEAAKNIPPVEFSLPGGERVSFSLVDAAISKPCVPKSNAYALNPCIFPAECRNGRKTYKGQLTVILSWKLNDRVMGTDEHAIAEVPIMVKSVACNLHGLKPTKLIEYGEEVEEMGGYFIVNGNEKVIRMLILQRRNYPMAVTRTSWKNRGPQYTEYGISIRCVASDQTSSNLILHYLNNGTVTMCLFHNKNQYYIPVIIVLKALSNTSDQHIFSELIKGREDDSFYKGCIANMMRQAQEEKLFTTKDILNYIGRTFRIKMNLPEWYTDRQISEYLFRECICIHLTDNMDKFNLLVFMTRKLYSFVAGECATENPDNPMFQEVLLSGHLYQMALKEKLFRWLQSLKTAILVLLKKKPDTAIDEGVINKILRHGLNISKSMEYLLATGNLVSTTGLGLSQAAGLTVVADKLNFMRYISHFRCVHRGAFFAQMRTTAVRKLLGEAWGFLCPVHTPDGPPCGLMNHMSATCHMVNQVYRTGHISKVLFRLGVIPYGDIVPHPYNQCYPVMLDGRMIGWLPHDMGPCVAEQLRMMKVKGLENIPRLMEICLVKTTSVASQYPGLSLFTGVARMMRPVKNLAYDMVEMIGTFEQAYMDICIIPEEAHEGITTHQELSEFSMLSTVASLTPFSDYNQSPRNMYQCQMGKQTMGSPLQAWQYRADNKLYRLQTPQTPLVRPYMHDHYHMDDYPVGTNAIVAVISYTGYDMEDAMILNKSSYERGFAHGSVYKAEFINLKQQSRGRGPCTSIFGCSATDPCVVDGHLDIDGLPPVGAYLEEGTPYYSYIDLQTLQTRIVTYRSHEPARVDSVKIIGDESGTEHLYHVCIVLRIQRNPIIGDKFSSRHGQKGICSQKWPVEDMPFSESGMTPDIIFNPHGFPSRMTIGMMIESMAGKSAASHGLVHDATPFTYTEDDPPTAYFGKMLTSAGYNYYGTERMYSGVDGREFEADIFIGVIYYQRLRHMVSDKFQVRTTGPVDQVTRQPVKGRKKGGGIRFGEMERDALISHGTSFLLHDRLLNCSDECKEYVCVKCGCLMSPVLEKPVSKSAAASKEVARRWYCLLCKRSDTVQVVRLPYVFRYLIAELASVDIKVTLDVKQIA